MKKQIQNQSNASTFDPITLYQKRQPEKWQSNFEINIMEDETGHTLHCTKLAEVVGTSIYWLELQV
jgi:hypothetical protein